MSEDALLQLAEREIRGVDDDVRLGPNSIEQTAFFRDRSGDASPSGERMAMARLGEAADQYLVAGLQEDDARLDASTLQRAAHRGHGQRRVSRPNVENDRHLLETLTILGNQFSQCR